MLSERFALDFLEKEGIHVVKREFCRSRFGIKKALSKVGYPFVLKSSGKKLISKKEFSGVRLDLKTYTQILHEFKSLKRIKNSNGVLIQKKLKGKEFFASIKREGNLKYVFSFGFFVSKKGEGDEALFRIFPAVKKNFKKIIIETEKVVSLSRKEKDSIERFLGELSQIIKKNSNINEIVVGSLFADGKNLTVANARVVLN